MTAELGFIRSRREAHLSQPATPRIVGSYATESPVRNVAVGDGVVLALTAESVVILRVAPVR